MTDVLGLCFFFVVCALYIKSYLSGLEMIKPVHTFIINTGADSTCPVVCQLHDYICIKTLRLGYKPFTQGVRKCIHQFYLIKSSDCSFHYISDSFLNISFSS